MKLCVALCCWEQREPWRFYPKIWALSHFEGQIPKCVTVLDPWFPLQCKDAQQTQVLLSPLATPHVQHLPVFSMRCCLHPPTEIYAPSL